MYKNNIIKQDCNPTMLFFKCFLIPRVIVPKLLVNYAIYFFEKSPKPRPFYFLDFFNV